jgi:death-on-curing protein
LDIGNQIYHITVDVVREIHAEAVSRFGGSQGVRDVSLLESAVAAPQASFGGTSIYSDAPEMAAAYLFFLCSNHPFVDGNKRTALGAAIVFLRLNGFTTKSDGKEWEELTLDVASSKIDREQTTQRLRGLISA